MLLLQLLLYCCYNCWMVVAFVVSEVFSVVVTVAAAAVLLAVAWLAVAWL